MREQTVVGDARQILKEAAEGVTVMPQECILDRIVEQCKEQFVSKFGEEMRLAEHVVAVPVLLL